jgi:hypothetical protein
MSQSQQQFRKTPSRRVSVTTAVGIAAERAALAARERDLVQARAAAQRLSGVGATTR